MTMDMDLCMCWCVCLVLGAWCFVLCVGLMVVCSVLPHGCVLVCVCVSDTRDVLSGQAVNEDFYDALAAQWEHINTQKIKTVCQQEGMGNMHAPQVLILHGYM